MGILDWLLGRTADVDQPPTRDERGAEPKRPVRVYERPYDIIADALQRWESGDIEEAEGLFRRGIEDYRRREPSEMDFALGRYGAFLIQQDRTDDATRVLEEAIERKTDIPAIWGDYLRLAADRRDVETFKRGAERMAASVKYEVDSEFFLSYARRADREGDSQFAEALARYLVDRATLLKDSVGRWAAIGDLGRILERAERPVDAAALWQSAFDEGSTDAETADRLSMYLERAKDYSGATRVIEQALKRHLPANVEETLRKRLSRCQDKLEVPQTKRPMASKRRRDVPAYSVRQASSLFEPIFQARLQPQVRDLEITGDSARCLLTSKESSTLVDIDLATGAETRRVENLPLLGDTWFRRTGDGIAVRRTAAIGKGATLLRFLGVDGSVTAEAAVPDATSEIALGPDLWYVGCRNGFLYGFGFDGKQRWAWETPGATDRGASDYFRPCPYYVASQGSFATVASMGNIYAVGSDGQTLWHVELPNERQTRWEYTVPHEGESGLRDAYQILGVTPPVTSSEIKSAYRRLALETHPDRNPDDEQAAARFRKVQGAYERAIAGDSSDMAGMAGMKVTIELHGLGPTASFIAANADGVVVGSSQGRLYEYDAKGKLRRARIVGDGPVRAAIQPDGRVAAAWCSDAVLFLRNGQVVNAAAALSWPKALTMLGNDVVLWRGNEVQIMDPQGRLLWAVEFSKNVTGVVAHDDTLVCAAGVLAAFRRTGSR